MDPLAASVVAAVVLVILALGGFYFLNQKPSTKSTKQTEKPKSEDQLQPTAKPAAVKKEKQAKPAEKKKEHESSRFKCSIRHHKQEVVHVEFSPCGKYLASSSEDQTLKLYPMETLFTHSHPHQKVNLADMPGRFCISSDGKYILQSVQISGGVNIYGVGDKKKGIFLVKQISAKAHHKQPIVSVDFSSNMKYILTCSTTDTRVALFDLKGNCLTSFTTNQMSNYIAKFDPSSRFIAVGAVSTDMKLWEVNEDKKIGFTGVTKAIQVASRSAHKKSVRTVDFFPDSSKMITGSDDGSWKVWNLNVAYKRDEDSNCLASVVGKDKTAIEYLRISPDGKKLALIRGRNIELWDVTTNQIIDTIEDAHSQQITAISWSQSSNLICSSSVDSLLRLWDA